MRTFDELNMKKFNLQIIFLNVLYSCLILCWSSCQSPVDFTTLSGEKKVLDDSVAVLIFLNTDCPICAKYQGEFKNLNKQHPATPIYYVFCGQQEKKDILDFCSYDSIPASRVVRDTSCRLAKRLGAGITPQAVILKQGKTVYTGRIDDRFANIGSSRPKASINYINNALISLSGNGTVQIAHTEAVGCFIECR
jgi:hypothetical protein